MAEIREVVMRMAGMVEEMIRLACDAACQSDPEIANRVVAMDDEVDRLESEIIRSLIVTQMRFAPVANDLRLITATYGVVTEIEQAADDAVKLARRSIKLTTQFPAELKKDLAQLGEATRVYFAKALKLYLDYSDELAEEIVQDDAGIDMLYKETRGKVFDMMQQDPTRVRAFVRVIDAFHSLEHVADHAVEIAKRLRAHVGSAAISSH